MNGKKQSLTEKETQLKNKIIEVLKRQGFKVNPHLRLPAEDKHTYQSIQRSAKSAQISEHRRFLLRFFDHAKRCHIDGRDIVPEDIDLEMREVLPASHEEQLFRWWNMIWWSMPYQRAYGRQMRFLLWDRGHDAPFGLVQLQSPLLRMKARDEYLGIPVDSLDYWANMSMSAQRIGALPPYNDLLGAKMVALSILSNEVRESYRRRYAGRKTLMEGRVLDADLLFVTTTGAFGKSSVYERLRYAGARVERIGWTAGIGTFHVPEHLVREIYAMLAESGVDVSGGYGSGPSRKVRLLKKGFNMLGLRGFQAHGIRRAVYLFSLAENARDVIHGAAPDWPDRPFNDIAAHWKERWAIPRAGRLDRWRKFDREEFFRMVKQTINTHECSNR